MSKIKSDETRKMFEEIILNLRVYQNTIQNILFHNRTTDGKVLPELFQKTVEIDRQVKFIEGHLFNLEHGLLEPKKSLWQFQQEQIMKGQNIFGNLEEQK